MAWYEFNQNNTGGSFETDEMICHRVFIEADNAMDANAIAIGMGIYFEGCSTGMDCGCCGDRWYPASGKGIKFPYNDFGGGKKFKTIKEYAQYLADDYGWTSPDARIYYADGKKVIDINSKNKRAA